MIDVDELAAAYRQSVSVPAGPGVAMIRARGRRRQNRSRAAVAAALVVALVAGGATTLVTRTEQHAVVTAADQEGELVPGVPVVMADSELSVLRDQVVGDLPVVAVPRLRGWTVEVVSASADRIYKSGTSVNYRLRSGDGELLLTPLPGSLHLPGPGRTLVQLDRPQGVVDAAVENTAEGLWLIWNEPSSLSDGLGVVVEGSDRATLVAAAERIEFEDQPVTGAAEPEEQDLPARREVVLQGRTSGTSWQVWRTDAPEATAAEALLTVAGRAPATGGKMIGSSTSGPAVDATTVSVDGRQITMIVVPLDATVTMIGAGHDPIELPRARLDDDRAVAVAPIPAGKQGGVIIVADDRGETMLGLPWAPPEGWTTFRTKLD